MKITKVEVIRNKEPIPLPQPWRAAWREPSGTPATALDFAFYKVYTDADIVGIGPYTGGNSALLDEVNPFHVEAFFDAQMSGRRAGNSGKGAAGLEIALWDIVGKAASLPVYKLLGARRDKLMVYAATSRLLEKAAHVQQVSELRDAGFKAVKLRMHRPNPWDDVAVIEAVRDAVGDDLLLLVDANQNNVSEGYTYWSRRTAQQVAKELDALNLYFLEEPLRRTDIEGLAEIAASVDMFIAGGEHSPTIYDFKEHVVRGAYDILQPDVALGGNMGITGLRKIAIMADYFDRQVIPHVLGNATLPIQLAATLQAMATVENCPMVEFPCDPPILTPETTQTLIAEPIWIDADGFVKIPDTPGIGIVLDEERLAGNVVVEVL